MTRLCLTLTKLVGHWSGADPSYGGLDLQGTKFGVYCTPLNGGTVRPNDRVRVLRRSATASAAAG